jgi:tripartite-type tricarboxylate transporter receptor subunit TctC
MLTRRTLLPAAASLLTLPATPMLSQLGYPVEAEAFWGALAPAATPKPIQQRYAEAVKTALAVPEVSSA